MRIKKKVALLLTAALLVTSINVTPLTAFAANNPSGTADTPATGSTKLSLDLSANKGYAGRKASGSTKLTLVVANHDWEYSVGTGENANKLIAKCKTEGHSAKDCYKNGVTLTLSASSANYSGSETYAASLGDTSAWTGAGLAVPTIKYYKATSEGGTEGTEEVTDLNGLAAGNYYAAVTVGTATAKAAFKVIPPHTHNGITFDKPLTLTDIKSQGIEAGNYYLTEDLELTSFIYINNKIVNLCLNGHVLKAPSGTNAISIQNGGELNLYDCGTTEHYFTVGDNGLWTLTGGKTDATETVVGGVITGGEEKNWSGGGAISVTGQYLGKRSTLNMCGGNIVGNSSIMFGGGVHVNGVFHMKGGTIQGNVAPNGAGVNVEDDSVFNLTNGEIKNNCVSTGNGGGVKYNGYDDNSFIVGGSAKICDNKRGSGETATDNNVYLFSDYITLGTGTGGNGVAVPTEGMSIGVTTKAGTGQFTSNGTENDVKYFTPDNDAYEVEYNASGYLQLVIPQEASHTTHDDIEFQPWVPADHDGALLPNVAGSWYLPGDVILTANWSAPEGTTNLCLNGKMLSLSTGRIIIPANATLNLYDCGKTEHIGYIDANHYWISGEVPDGNTKTTIVGGCIYAALGSHPITIQPNGTLNMYGGTITGHSSNIYYTSVIAGDTTTKSGGWFNMYGGTITGNSSGSIKGFAAVKNQGIVRFEYLDGVTVGKDAVIDDNYVYYYDNATTAMVYEEVNLVAPEGRTFTLGTGDYAPTEKMHVGISSVTAPVLGTPVVFTGANAGENDASRFESNMEGIHVERRKNNALYLCVEDEPAYVPCTCIDHKEKQNGQAATCTEDGWNDYYQCTECGALYADEDMTDEITDLAAWKTDDGKLGKTGHDWTYSANENVVTATCKNNAAHTATLTLTKNAAENYYVYDGNAKTVDFATDEAAAWKAAVGTDAPTITYEAKEGSELTEGKAVNAGSYTAKITVGGVTASINFEITQPGGGSSSAPTITVPVTGNENSVKVSASVSGSTATVKTITDAELNKVTGGEAVEIDLTGLKKDIDTAKIPTATVEKIAEQGGMSVKLSTATVTFDSKATETISEQAKGNTIELVVDDIQTVSLNAVQKEAVQKLDAALIIDAYLVSNGIRLCSESKGGFGGGKATVALPYEIKGNRTAANYSVYYVDDAGKLEKLNASYDADAKAFVFDIEHFSNYVVAYDENAMLFVDVAEGSFYYDAVLWAAKNGITTGADATHFNPNGGTTRAHVVTFLWRASGCPEPTGNASKFTDVVIGSYYEKAVAWAIEQGITKGTSDTTFSPDKVCTRGQIVTFLARFAGVKDEDAGYTHGFTDVKATDYYNNAVAWAKDNKVTEGTSATTFSPNVDCTRAQVVTFLWRWMVK